MSQLINGVELLKQAQNNINNKTENDKVLLYELVEKGIDELFGNLSIEMINKEFEKQSKTINDINDLVFECSSVINLLVNMINVKNNLLEYVNQYKTINESFNNKFDNLNSLKLNPFVKTLFDAEYSIDSVFRIIKDSCQSATYPYHIMVRFYIRPSKPIYKVSDEEIVAYQKSIIFISDYEKYNTEFNRLIEERIKVLKEHNLYSCNNYLYIQVINEEGDPIF